MGKTINALVLGVGGNVSMGIVKALRNSKLPIRIIGGCISKDSLGLYSCDAAYISPYAQDKNFISWIANLCTEESIDIVFSGVEEIVYSIEKNRNEFERLTNAIFISSSKEVLDIGADKLLTANWLKEAGVNYPKTVRREDEMAVKNLVAEFGFPLIAKPRKGKGSQGIVIINSNEDLLAVKSDNYCVQQYLGDEKSEYTVACYRTKEGGVEDIIIFRRDLKYGTTFYAEIIQDEVIKEECLRIVRALQPDGPLNVQLRMHNGIPVCFELNIRFSGTSAIRAHFGYNDVVAMVNEFVLNKDASDFLTPKKEGKAYRYFEELFIDIDKEKALLNEGKF